MTMKICPRCGYERPVQYREYDQVQGELQMLKSGSLSEPPTIDEFKKRLARVEQGRAESLEDLFRIAEKRGYKRQWAHMVYNARQSKKNRPVGAMV